MIKRILVALALLAALGGCKIAQPGVDTPYTWEVYAVAAGCECHEFNAGDPNFQRVVTLVNVTYGFTLDTGKVVTKSESLTPTPWHQTGFSPKGAVTVELHAQSAENADLVCVIYQGSILLGAFASHTPGGCSGSADE